MRCRITLRRLRGNTPARPPACLASPHARPQRRSTCFATSAAARLTRALHSGRMLQPRRVAPWCLQVAQPRKLTRLLCLRHRMTQRPAAHPAADCRSCGWRRTIARPSAEAPGPSGGGGSACWLHQSTLGSARLSLLKQAVKAGTAAQGAAGGCLLQTLCGHKGAAPTCLLANPGDLEDCRRTDDSLQIVSHF